MAVPILSSHPISTLPRDSELSQILELRDPFLIPLADLDLLIQEAPTARMQGYLFGVRDMRLMLNACTGLEVTA
ncbi:hypothetical protein PP715_21355 [Ralstonia solanacearum]|uniref:Uncharacterized protein n=2 Tax=Ralstonia TaxID=48736 RepID=A0A5H2PYV6_RALSL|nr:MULTISPECIES: hypothetical protein [Ralstonia]AMP70037.1 hypothetical protein UW163_11430 [Ralstonia solanacearum]AYB60426.1 hypothetical protein C2124_07370 [Ralstonia solanacearum]MBB6587255.1 hypothetical protein [Ralstonia solanacearum]MCG3577352.1 hypothetical protein [Ralstonia solanacearum]MCL9842365.1 hypothetical protein [Ralstonia solanacearum]